MTRGKPLSFDRDEVLEKAMERFWMHGYEATGMTELLAHMGIQRQSFYNTFKSKKDIYKETIELYAQTMGQKIMATLRKPQNPLRNVEDVIDIWESAAEEAGFCGCLIGNAIAEFGSEDKKLCELLIGKIQGLEDALCEAFERAYREGLLPEHRKPRALARTFVVTIQGMALLSKTRQDNHEEVTRDVMTTLRGLLKG